jgi:hypothetical protein
MKERSVAKKSQPIIKASIKTKKKKCNFEGCINQARGKGGGFVVPMEQRGNDDFRGMYHQGCH